MRPLLFKRVLEAGLAPADIRERWALELRQVLMQNLALEGELISVCRAFRAAGVACLALKGPTLAHIAYGDQGLREYCDLDLLVRPQSLPVAVSLLGSSGFRPPQGLEWLSPAGLRRWAVEMPYSSERGITIDLHWKLTPQFDVLQIDEELLWNSTHEIALAGTRVPTIAPEPLFIFLAVHGAKHCWEHMGWIADLAWLTHSIDGFDFSRTYGLAKRLQNERAFLLACALMRDVFGCELPDTLRSAIAEDSRITGLLEAVHRRWRTGPLETPDTGEMLAFGAQMTQSRTALLGSLFAGTFRPSWHEWQRYKLPEPLFWLYAPLRIPRLLRKHVGRLSIWRREP